MRKKIALLLVAVIGSHMAIAQGKANVPAGIKADFAKRYPNATQVKWELENGRYESSFFVARKEMSVVYGPGGGIEEIETKITVDELPAKAKDIALKKGSIHEAAKIELANGTIRYEAEVKGKDLIFDDKGTFLMEKVEKENDKK